MARFEREAKVPDDFAARPVPGTEGGDTPLFSPRWPMACFLSWAENRESAGFRRTASNHCGNRRTIRDDLGFGWLGLLGRSVPRHLSARQDRAATSIR